MAVLAQLLLAIVAR